MEDTQSENWKTVTRFFRASEKESHATSNLPKLRLWISGFLSRELTVRDLWQVATKPPVLILQAAFGFTGGWILGMDRPFEETVLLSFGSAPVPIAMTWVMVTLMNLWVRLRQMLPSETCAKPAIIPTLLISVTAFWILIGFRQLVLYNFISGFMVGNDVIIRMMVVSVIAHELGMLLVFRFMLDTLLPPAVEKNSFVNFSTAHFSERTAARAEDRNEVIRIGRTRVQPDDILFLHAQGNYLHIGLRDDASMERYRISAAIKLLGEHRGFSPHRSYWIAYDAIESFAMNNGIIQISLTDGTQVPGARTRNSEIRKKLEELSLPKTKTG